MICTKKNHAGGENCVTCVEHQVWQQAGERRKKRGINLKQFRIDCEGNAVASLNNYWNGWVETLGSKEKAVDYLLVVMRNADDRLRATLENMAIPRRTQGKAKFEKVSAPRLED